jgi:uncharacterized protein (DUF427 family)
MSAYAHCQAALTCVRIGRDTCAGSHVAVVTAIRTWDEPRALLRTSTKQTILCMAILLVMCPRLIAELNEAAPILARISICPLQRIDSMETKSASRPVKVPGPDHPITIERNPARIVVSLAGRVIADTREALSLREANYPAVQYIPRKDVEMSLLERTDHTTYCPYKGDCSYYSLPLGGSRSANSVWTYESPYTAVAAIKDYVAFYPDRVDSIVETPIL